MMFRKLAAGLGAAALTSTLFAAPALASAPMLECPGGGYGTSLLSSVTGNLDDGSIEISISEVFPSGMNVLGVLFTEAWVNINGNVTFENALSTYTPEAIPGLTQATIAPYFADVDMSSGQGDIYFCSDPANQRVLITWENVGYYDRRTDKLNSFQIVLRNTAGQCEGADTYDVQFRYNRLEWTTGDASDGSGGLGGTPAVGGIDAGDTDNAVAVPGSGTAAMLDLVNLSNTGTPGLFEFQVAEGQLPTCGDGFVDVCEECDGGPGCTPLCTFSVCGDGYLDAATEQCDGDQFVGGTPSCPAGYTGTPLCNNDPNNAQGDGTCTVSAVPGGCVDIDECAQTSGLCGAGQCNNIGGSYECACDSGYEFDGTTCVDIDECTENPAICGQGQCSDSEGSYSCACDAGFEFDGTTCVNVDECAEDAAICGPGQCLDNVGAYDCVCDAGFEFDGTTCVNINECVETPDICGEGQCSDTSGSYDCACDAGYTFDGTTCVDVNECVETPGICGEGGTCSNSTGSYACSCAAGYELVDGACADINECAEDASICGPGTCSNTGGSYACACEAGYAFDGTSCVDIDECVETPGVCGPGQCNDADGSYSCSCEEGYAFDGTSCVNVDECTETPGICGPGQCSDADGSYSCSCEEGYAFDGTSCVNVDECTETPGICGPGQCSDADGSYSCSCEEGYAFDGTSCVNVDECTETPGVCGPGQCSDADGSYSCSCEEGYAFDGTSCVNVDECTETPGICGPGQCSDADGSYSCACEEGYEFDGESCVNVDECALDTDTCHAQASCADTDGSFSCTCLPGFVGDGELCTAQLTIIEPLDESVTSENAPTLSGVGEPGAEVAISIDGDEVATVTVDSNGDWSVTLDEPLEDGQYEIVADDGRSDDTIIVVIDTVAPVLTVDSPEQDVRYTESPERVEGQAEPGDIIEIIINDEIVGTTVADESGAYSFEFDAPLDEGVYELRVTATDEAGNMSEEVVDFSVDSTDGVQIDAPAEGDLVRTSTPTLSGSAEPGATVTILVDGEEVGETVADDLGQWSYQLEEALEDGEFSLGASVESPSGVREDRVEVTIDTSTTAVIIDAPVDGALTNEASPEISGSAAPGATIAIIIDGDEVAEVEADANGQWSYTPDDALDEGQHVIEVVAEDAGIRTEAEVAIEVDLSAPELTVDSPTEGQVLYEDERTISGSAEPGAVIEVELDGEVIDTVVVGEDGQWSVSLPEDVEPGEHTIEVSARDEAGNVTTEERGINVAEALQMYGGGGLALGSSCATVPGQGQSGVPLWLLAAAGVMVWRRRRR
ncbi:hypothetical protein FRC96_14200 [Lujinxingia vulgaris]|uniref:Nidogen n=2 Tax=Lujinxingia vulgaris TaxID=2600176 RepID=A0A5C6X5L4_9DELT|nr:hypothetical protein FRC96_14200 [Lujinxingia vulgaris]